MKKVPFLGDIEQGVDNSIKEIMGPLGTLYPTLKYAVILSNPSTALGYAAYRSIPYLGSALTSKKAINTYKTVGKSMGKGLLKLGAAGLKVGAKYGKEAIFDLGAITSKQISKSAKYLKDKDFSLNNIKDKLKDFTSNLSLTNEDDIPKYNNYSMQTEHYIDQKARANARTIGFLTGIRERDAIYQKQKDAIRKRVEKEGLPQKKYDDVELESDNTLENEQSNENTKDIFAMSEPETIEFSEPMSEEDFYRKPQFVKNVSICDNCSMIFHRTSTGYTKQIKFGDNLGAVKDITKEEYEKIISSAENSKEKDKEREVEFELS